jgi:hypothetical protein
MSERVNTSEREMNRTKLVDARRFNPQWTSFMNPLDPPVNGQNGYTSMCHPWAGENNCVFYFIFL